MMFLARSPRFALGELRNPTGLEHAVQAVNSELLRHPLNTGNLLWRRTSSFGKEDCIFPGDTLFVPVYAPPTLSLRLQCAP
jgi:hypothetical protein